MKKPNKIKFLTGQFIVFLITLGVVGYIFNFTSIPNEVISNYAKYDKNASYQDIEVYLCIYSFIFFYFIIELGLIRNKNDVKNDEAIKNDSK